MFACIFLCFHKRASSDFGLSSFVNVSDSEVVDLFKFLLSQSFLFFVVFAGRAVLKDSGSQAGVRVDFFGVFRRNHAAPAVGENEDGDGELCGWEDKGAKEN